MEGKYQEKGRNEVVQTKLPSENHILRRPKSFSFEKRSDVYYFSDNSARGILKRVPIKNGSYKLNELETVLEKPDARKIRNEIWSDVPLNSNESSEADVYTAADKNDDSFDSLVHREQRKNNVLKEFDKAIGIKDQSERLENFAILNANKNYPKTKNDGKKALRDINEDQNEERSYKPFRELKQKKYHPNISAPTESENSMCASDDICKKLSDSKIRSDSSKKTNDYKDNYECLNETWNESSLTDVLNMMSTKTPVTEL